MGKDNTIDSEVELREKLAAIEHERWADWQKWCHKILRVNIKHDIEPTLEHWEKQIATPYHKLTRPEQLSDLEQVDRYWPLIEQYIAQEANKARIDELHLVNRNQFSPAHKFGRVSWPTYYKNRIERLQNKTNDGGRDGASDERR